MAQSQHSDQAWHGPLAIAFYRAQEILAQSQRQEVYLMKDEFDCIGSDSVARSFISVL